MIACLALPDLKPTGRVIKKPADVIDTAFDSTMTRYAMCFGDGKIQISGVADEELLDRFNVRGDRDIFIFEFNPDGRYLAARNNLDGAVTVWDTERHKVAVEDPRPVSVNSAEFSPDSRRIAVGLDDGEVVVYDLAGGQASMRHRMPAPPQDLAFRADGNEIAVLYDEQARGTCQILEVRSGRPIRSILLPSTGASVAWSADSSMLAVSGGDSKIYLWDTATGTRKATLVGSTSLGITTAFHPAGTLLASTGWEGRLRLWDPVLARQWLTVNQSTLLRFSPDGRIVLEHAGKLTTYQVDPALEHRTIAHVSSQRIGYQRPSIRHDGRLLALGTDAGVVIWDLARGTELSFLTIG